ncbi:hypothetical protein ACFQH8_17180 [Halomicroarcula sp. GCM10025710]
MTIRSGRSWIVTSVPVASVIVTGNEQCSLVAAVDAPAAGATPTSDVTRSNPTSSVADRLITYTAAQEQ